MKEDKIVLTFQCPVKWNNMAPFEDGRYCSVCKTTVKDFTGFSVKEIAASANSEYSCGSFRATQLHKPFNDKRDVLIRYYQNLTSKNRPGKILVMLITVLLFISGCRSRRLSGAYAYGWDYKNNGVEKIDTSRTVNQEPIQQTGEKE